MQEVVGRFQICAILKRHNSIQSVCFAPFGNVKIVFSRHNGIHHVHQCVSHLGSSLLSRGLGYALVPLGVMVRLYGN